MTTIHKALLLSASVLIFECINHFVVVVVNTQLRLVFQRGIFLFGRGIVLRDLLASDGRIGRIYTFGLFLYFLNSSDRSLSTSK